MRTVVRRAMERAIEADRKAKIDLAAAAECPVCRFYAWASFHHPEARSDGTYHHPACKTLGGNHWKGKRA